jgi:hypothetical protein
MKILPQAYGASYAWNMNLPRQKLGGQDLPYSLGEIGALKPSTSWRHGLSNQATKSRSRRLN